MAALTWLKRNLEDLVRAGISAARQDTLPRALGPVIAELEKLNRSTEKDFLEVGEKLMKIRAAAQQISSGMTGLGEMISGQAGDEACRALETMLGNRRDMDARIGRSGAAFARVLDLSSRMRQSFAPLPNTVAMFRTICTLTRIETTRLGSAGVDFGNLAEEVKPLSERIQSSGEGVLETAAELDRGVQSALQKGTELQASELKDLQSLAGGIMASLNSFEERRQRAREVSATQAAQYAAVGEGIDDVVRSIQFHDITRQQVEHVVQALRQLSSEGGGGGARFGSLAPDPRVILSLQDAQLGEAARVFAWSVTSIEQDLSGIAVQLGEMAEASREMMGISSGGQDSFFANMEGSLASILEGAGACAATETQMRRLAAELAGLMQCMRESIADIRGTEISIERIAINATIHATQIGASGNALNVVAEVMRRLALDSNGYTESVAAALEAMLDAVNGMDEEAGRAETAVRSDPDAVYAGIHAAIRGLHSSSESSAQRVQEIAALGARLAEEISTAGGNFAPGRVFAESIDRVRGELARLGAHSRPLVREHGQEATARHLEQFAAGYTMQRQREIHESVLAGSALAVKAADTPGAALEEVNPGDEEPNLGVEEPNLGDEAGNLGDNVELF